MSHPLDPTPCFIFYSIIFNKKNISLKKVIEQLGAPLDKLNCFYPCFNPLSFYYSKEMGEKNQLERVIIFDQRLAKREDLISVKLMSYEIEKSLTLKPGGRVVNLDPGYISLENCILSTFKPYSHRIYLSQGVWAEPNYFFERGSYKEFPWTYPDYRHLEKVATFNTQRSLLKSLI